MTNEKYTPEGLPIVTRELIETLTRDSNKDLRIYGDIPTDDDESLFQEEIEKMMKTNPKLFSYLEKLARGFYDANGDLTRGYKLKDIITISYLTGVVSCYTALRRQAEANKLEENLMG